MRSLHPSETAGDGRIIDQSKYRKRTDKPDRHIKCAQCGFDADLDTIGIGPSLGSVGAPSVSTKLVRLPGPRVLRPGEIPIPGGFQDWSLGTLFSNPSTATPIVPGWTALNSGATFDVSREATIIDALPYAVKMDVSVPGTVAAIQHSVVAYQEVLGKNVSLSCRVKHNQDGFGFTMSLYDGTTLTYSNPYIPGDNQWHTAILEAFPVALNAGQLQITLNTQAGSPPTQPYQLYMASALLVLGDVAGVFDPLSYDYIVSEPSTTGAGCPFCHSMNPQGNGRNRDPFTAAKLSLENL